MASTTADNDKYQNSPYEAYTGALSNLDTTDINVALLADTYSPDFETHNHFQDVSGDEVSGNGYDAGGLTIGGTNFLEDDAGQRVYLDSEDTTTWPNSTITARYAVVYDDGPAAGGKTLLCLLDFGENMSSDDGDFTIDWDANGIFEVDYAPA